MKSVILKNELGSIARRLRHTPSPALTPFEVLPSIVVPLVPFQDSTKPACPNKVLPRRQTMIVPAGKLPLKVLALIVLFLVARLLARPLRVFGKPFTPAESRQKFTKHAHHAAPFGAFETFWNLCTQYPPLLPTSFVPIKPFAIWYVL